MAKKRVARTKSTSRKSKKRSVSKKSAPKNTSAPWSHGTFYWNEKLTRDIERDKTFYAKTIGWTFQAMPMPDGGTYWCAIQGGKPVAGFFSIDAPDYRDVPECWMSYLAVDDVDKRVTKALNTGARLMKPTFDVAGVGRIAVLMEPGGAGVGWMTPKR